jgi:hypothetical protein
VVASPEFSKKSKTGLKRLDFLVNEQKWGIEALATEHAVFHL